SPVFEWDNRKARSNFAKHRVKFTEEVSVFSDPLARIFPDEAHSGSEVREIMIGHSSGKHLLLVCFTEPVMDHIRIISARRATTTEQRDYEEHLTVQNQDEERGRTSSRVSIRLHKVETQPVRNTDTARCRGGNARS
ncbi:MAG: BrnT family toxin, partial [Bryobacterales bacterium]|nr:BrnT family toxin [Bryobacterales bacterium]